MTGLSCRKLAEIVAHGGASDLSLRQRFALRLHVRLCPPCRTFVRQLEKLGEITCEDLEAKMDQDCCDETLQRLEASILNRCDLGRDES